MRGVHVVAIAGLLTAALAPLAASYPWGACDVSSNYTASSAFQENLRALAATLPGNVSSSPDLFAAATAGAAPDTVYALALCPPFDNQNVSGCHACVKSGFADAQKLCPFNRGVTIVYNPCIFSFYGRDILNSSTNPKDQEVMLYNAQNVTVPNVGDFNRATYELLNGTADYAARAARRFATGEISFDATYPRIYGMAWCTPDMAPRRCRACLAAAIAEMPGSFIPNTQGARIAGARCTVRFEVYPFYNGSGMVQMTASAPAAVPVTPGKKSSKIGKVLAIVLPIVAALLASTTIGFCCWRRRAKITKRSLSYASHTEDIQSIESLIIDLSTLRIATNNFAENNKLGEGGFGAVYKGFLPGGGQEIAVKRLSQNSGQGIGELKNELALIAKLQHKNLVRLVGVCLEEDEKLLVYEYMPNKSLDTFLFDSEKRKQIDWGKRFMIIKGIAGGLQYLHEDSQLKIVHRDLKASNVLLDTNMSPKISDFGLARLFGEDQSLEITNRVVGTYGYMAPEYALRGHYSVKSDIYSFGVLILEIITGRKNSDSFNSEESVDLLSLGKGVLKVDIQDIESLIMDLTTLRIATNNFAENNKLGEGGFGVVYKGSLPNGQDIAVKRLSPNSTQGIGELKNELALIAKLQHKNLVRLVGVCLEEDEKLLAYEYMPNKNPEKRKQLDWGKRLMIIKGIARGLQYLHEDSQLKIVHRDLKASNVLLDTNMNPKISDFGLARLFGEDQSLEITNRVVGTYGYMAPEYALRGHYSIKSDIYSFGVLILEAITGRKNSDSYKSEQYVDLLSLIWEHWAMKITTEMVDPFLRSDSSLDGILRCIHIGLVCVQEAPMDRPTISEINMMLDSNTIPVQTPSRPAFFSQMSGSSGSVVDSITAKSKAMSLNEVSITEPKPR
uniref:Protein kinase domain-containing protein n=1 Tax=Oryza rufipogon TaxID=4529 RepID=A0A0E0QBL0_ORYRU